MAGMTTSINGNNDIVAFRVAANLGLSDGVVYAGSGVEYANSVCVMPGDDHVYFAGSSSTGGSNPDIYVVRTEANLTFDNSRYYFEYGKTFHEWANCIIPVPSSNTLTIAGANRSGDGILMNINTDLTNNWAYKSNQSNNADSYNSVALLANGGYAITGFYRTPGGSNELLVALADADGNSCCNDAMHIDVGHYASHKKVGAIYTGGFELEAWGAFDDYFNEVEICNGETERTISTNPDDASSLLVVPNPNNGSFKINVVDTNEEIESIMIYDISGRVISSSVFEEATTTADIKLEKINSGIYSVVVTGRNQTQWRTTISVIK